MFGVPTLPRTLEAALRDLGADRPGVRVEAVRDLVRHAEEARDTVIGALCKALRDPAAQVRARAATSLADLEAREAHDDLLAAVDDGDVLVQQMALAALGEIGDERSTDRIRAALGDKRAEVRFQAVIAYPRVCKDRDLATEALLRASRDDDGLVSHIALRMAEELSQAEGADGAVDERFLVRARALLHSGSPEARVTSAILLAKSGDARAGEVLVQVARGELRTRDREDEAAAIELTGELGVTAAKPGLERRAFGGLLGFRRDPLAWHARVALARMGHERACREILSELSARDRDVCTLAVAAAGRARLVAARDRIAALRGEPSRADPHAVDEALAALTLAAEAS